MASRASSEAPAPGAPDKIPSLPGLGTTWYKRGAAYWIRRTLTAILWLALLALLYYTFALGIYQGFRTVLPPTVRTVSDWAQVAASPVALVLGWLRQRRDHRKSLLDPPTPGEFRRRKREQAGRNVALTFASRGLVLIAAPIMPAFFGYIIGWFVAYLTVREYPSEVGARRSLQG
ncbi:hypothetical protein [Streptomyces sp. YIM S03343]